MWLTPKSVGGAELTLGGIDNTKFSSPITYIPVDPETQVELTSIHIESLVLIRVFSHIGILATCLYAIFCERQDLHRAQEDHPCHL